MVRLLLLAIFFLNLGAYAHNDAFDKSDCEDQLTPHDFQQARMYGFLKKLTEEIDHLFPADKNYRLAIGRASGPLVAGLRNAGSQAATLPVKVNFDGLLLPRSAAEKRFEEALKFYLPDPKELNGKTLVLLIYGEDPLPFIPFAAQVKWYLSWHKIPVQNVAVHFITRQDTFKNVSSILADSFSSNASQVHVRPLALSNEVRHWLHDSLGDHPSAHEFSMIDVYSDRPLTLSREPREEFTELVADLRQLPARMQAKSQ